ncbi:MAG: hypothetical protein ACXWEK_03510 [Solirubrobacterales bacterium]
MAERTSQTLPPISAESLWRSRALVAIAALVLSGSLAPGGPPTPPALAVDRPRLARGGVLAPTLISVSIRTLARWLRLRLVLPAIGTAPTSRSDTPVLPTVGRPRDHPDGRRPLGAR